MDGLKETINEERWHGRLLQEGVKEDRSQDSALIQRGCFTWLRDWPCAPTHTIAGIWSSVSTYTPTQVNRVHKTGTTKGDVSCGTFGESPETLAHVLSGCSPLAQSRYLERHNAALKIFFFELARDLKLIDSVPPWESPAVPIQSKSHLRY